MGIKADNSGAGEARLLLVFRTRIYRIDWDISHTKSVVIVERYIVAIHS